ncbi:MAG: hypothetical protein QM778_18890 [Myxococcales bacterium]
MRTEWVPAYHITPASRIEATEERLGMGPGAMKSAVRRAIAYTVIAYVPFALAVVLDRLRAGVWDPRVQAIDTHVRTLISLPLFLLAEHVVDVHGRAATAYLTQAGVVPSEAQARFRAITDGMARLRDSNLAELVMFALAVGSSSIHVNPIPGSTMPISGLGTAVMLVLFRFVLLRWTWSWTLYTIFLARVSRLDLQLVATHPDRMGGLGVLLGPANAFSLVAAGASAAIAGSWANNVIYQHAPLELFQPAAMTFVLATLLLSMGPLWFFSGQLCRTRRDGLIYYGAYVHRFGQAFEAWTAEHPPAATLDAPQISVLADLGSDYERVGQMRVVLWSAKAMLTLLIGCVVPMVPLLLIERRVPELVIELLKALT